MTNLNKSEKVAVPTKGSQKSSKKLNIGWFYPHFLNLYGDRGNVEILKERALRCDIEVEVFEISLETTLDASLMNKLNLVFMGGGPDLSQQKIYKDFLDKKGSFLVDFLEANGVGLFICGSYQLLGNYYKSADGSILEGLGFLDFYTEAREGPRSIGNAVATLHEDILSDIYFQKNNTIGDEIVGFENHGGRTYLSGDLTPLATTTKAFGNNSRDTTEGVLYKNTLGTYFHGPVLARNPHLADFLIAKALGIEELAKLDDSVIVSAHARSKELAR
ncbi:glutamine amidotransferase [candidate division WWE3 bacterium]|nr:glutamine amidotransferase [candidate division WWE3 bacterium]